MHFTWPLFYKPFTMAKRKLTPKLKDYLYANRWKAKMSDYDGDALSYLKRLRAATKAAKKRKANTAKIGSVTIPRNSELYEIIEASANLKRQSVASFIRANKGAIEELLQEGRVVISRETQYAIDDISKLPTKSKVYINGEKVTKGDAIYALQSLTSTAMQHTSVVLINYEMSYDLAGNLYLEIPTQEDIEEAEENGEYDEDGSNETMYELLEQGEHIVLIQSPKKK